MISLWFVDRATPYPKRPGDADAAVSQPQVVPRFMVGGSHRLGRRKVLSRGIFGLPSVRA
jgi:hypothetical protein